MKLSVHMVDGNTVTVESIPADSIMALVEAFGDEDTNVLALNLANEAMTYLLRSNICRIDVDEEDES